MSNLTILSTSIRTFDNLYSLTDLHRVSGGEEKHRPSHFLRLDQTKELISAIESENSNVQICTFKIIRGSQGGTYACEELALAYATWISPKFHLVVLRAFIAMHKGEYSQNLQQIAPLVDPLKEIISREMPLEHLLRFVSLWFRLYDCNKVMDHLKAPLEQLGSKHAAHVYSCAVEDKITLGILKRILEPMLNDIEVPEHERHYRRALEELRNYKPTGIGKLATI
ncbi:KilA-N domain-containing protein [Actinobacillus equuli subsp. equuli]|uniref:KilA-N domain-containing protein n=1 Tax=Actinobacillus equuli subsp. equuli TaxID=202947 RepID=A0A9X4G723_ACTEU|nr:KilA-N domain-containing protein [Actinobacillus equuli]MDE8035776.1 KilA-N domain-containing protein [Actinobacillus equuli subsp. equuli]MDG4948409.1 KilA-N domain-containing protein [Actinobacillus equuli subsp. haemolyticus]